MGAPVHAEQICLFHLRFASRSVEHNERVAHAVNRGGVNPVDAHFERAMDGGDGRFVVLLAPGEFPACTADGPCAEAHGRDE